MGCYWHDVSILWPSLFVWPILAHCGRLYEEYAGDWRYIVTSYRRTLARNTLGGGRYFDSLAETSRVVAWCFYSHFLVCGCGLLTVCAAMDIYYEYMQFNLH